jgi:hypothetical protein
VRSSTFARREIHLLRIFSELFSCDISFLLATLSSTVWAGG